jgi:hypothetical protein
MQECQDSIFRFACRISYKSGNMHVFVRVCGQTEFNNAVSIELKCVIQKYVHSIISR